MFAPRDRCGVAVVVNRGGTFFPEAVAKGVFDQLLGLPDADWVAFYRDRLAERRAQVKAAREKRAAERKAGTKPSHELAAYAGAYEEPAYGRLRVTPDGEGLTLAWGPRTFRLGHYHYDTFTATVAGPDVLRRQNPDFEELVVFRLGADGEVESLTFLGQAFTRVKGKK
jgi:hypothetical protein